MYVRNQGNILNGVFGQQMWMTSRTKKDDLKNEDNPKQDLETILVFLAAQTNLLILFAKVWDFQNQLCYTNTIQNKKNSE